MSKYKILLLGSMEDEMKSMRNCSPEVIEEKASIQCVST